MRRYKIRLAVIAALILSAALGSLALGYSDTFAVLATILVTALTWAPVMVTLESMARLRREERNRG